MLQTPSASASYHGVVWFWFGSVLLPPWKRVWYLFPNLLLYSGREPPVWTDVAVCYMRENVNNPYWKCQTAWLRPPIQRIWGNPTATSKHPECDLAYRASLLSSCHRLLPAIGLFQHDDRMCSRLAALLRSRYLWIVFSSWCFWRLIVGKTTSPSLSVTTRQHDQHLLVLMLSAVMEKKNYQFNHKIYLLNTWVPYLKCISTSFSLLFKVIRAVFCLKRPDWSEVWTLGQTSV